MCRSHLRPGFGKRICSDKSGFPILSTQGQLLLLHGSSKGEFLLPVEGMALPFASVPGVRHQAMCSML